MELNSPKRMMNHRGPVAGEIINLKLLEDFQGQMPWDHEQIAVLEEFLFSNG